MKIKIFYNYLFHLQKQINLLGKYINTEVLNYLHEDFFQIISGLKSEVKLELDKKISLDTFIFLIYFKIVNGSDIFFEIKENILNIKNNDVFDNLKIEKIKELLLNEEIETIDNSDIPIVILTCNRTEQLKECIKEYLNNFNIFSHSKVKIFVSDDSNIENLIENKKLENTYNIKVINSEEKTFFIDNLFKKKDNNIYYTFGGNKLNSSYGRNRNFVSLYFYQKEFISLDDDSLPFTLTVKPNFIYDYIKDLEYISCKNLDDLINCKNLSTFLIPIDFYTYYKFFAKKLMFSKYCGQKDMETYYILIKQMNIDFRKIGVKNKSRLEPDYFIYGNKSQRGAGIHTLCTYFPKDFKNRVTLSSNFRIEDLIIGANYYAEKKLLPVETAFAIFHNREKITYFDPTSIINEILSKEVYSKYIEIIHLLGTDDFFEKFPIYINKYSVSISEEKVIDTKRYILHLCKIFCNTLELTKDERIFSILNVLKDINSIQYNDLKIIMERLTNRILKELSKNIVVFKYLDFL
jgi:hypothetical protein